MVTRALLLYLCKDRSRFSPGLPEYQRLTLRNGPSVSLRSEASWLGFGEKCRHPVSSSQAFPEILRLLSSVERPIPIAVAISALPAAALLAGRKGPACWDPCPSSIAVLLISGNTSPAAIPTFTFLISTAVAWYDRTAKTPLASAAGTLSPRKKSSRYTENKDVPPLKRTYAVGFAVSALLHGATLALPGESHGTDIIMNFAPVLINSLYSGRRLRQNRFIYNRRGNKGCHRSPCRVRRLWDLVLHCSACGTGVRASLPY